MNWRDVRALITLGEILGTGGRLDVQALERLLSAMPADSEYKKAAEATIEWHKKLFPISQHSSSSGAGD